MLRWFKKKKLVERSIVPLLTDLQFWLCVERPDLAKAFDLQTELGQSQFLTWWDHHGRREYQAPEEAMQWDQLTRPSPAAPGRFTDLVNIRMRACWAARPDLQSAFDLNDEKGRLGFFEWFYRGGLFECGLETTPYVDFALESLSQPATKDECKASVSLFTAAVLNIYSAQLEDLIEDPSRLESQFGSKLKELAPELWFIYGMMPYGVRPTFKALAITNDVLPIANTLLKGVTMVGYSHGAFGMGEHVRMSTRALATQTDEFSMLDVPAYNHMRIPEPDISEWLTRPRRPKFNIFHVNADAMAGAIMSVGPSVINGSYNIGYWAWELSRVPSVWKHSVDLVDEIWAPSTFIADAFRQFTTKPVTFMPLAVDIFVRKWFDRSHFSLPQDKFLFFYMFDSYSYYERKNPFAALRAFQLAFPTQDDVGIVIKTQNADEQGEEWLRLKAMAKRDKRVFIINRTLTRDEVFSLTAICDCFVSLHRSEGFGRAPAEAMWLGKPVIVTDYSGNTDFTTPEVSLPVNFELIPVEAGQYPFAEGQVWANPDEEHASWQMRRIVEDATLSHELGVRAARLMRAEFSPDAVGRRYADRLRALEAI